MYHSKILAKSSDQTVSQHVLKLQNLFGLCWLNDENGTQQSHDTVYLKGTISLVPAQ